eukprot:4142747-Pyramimonas_sp.AAC.1
MFSRGGKTERPDAKKCRQRHPWYGGKTARRLGFGARNHLGAANRHFTAFRKDPLPDGCNDGFCDDPTGS